MFTIRRVKNIFFRKLFSFPSPEIPSESKKGISEASKIPFQTRPSPVTVNFDLRRKLSRDSKKQYKKAQLCVFYLTENKLKLSLPQGASEVIFDSEVHFVSEVSPHGEVMGKLNFTRAIARTSLHCNFTFATAKTSPTKKEQTRYVLALFCYPLCRACRKRRDMREIISWRERHARRRPPLPAMPHLREHLHVCSTHPKSRRRGESLLPRRWRAFL